MSRVRYVADTLEEAVAAAHRGHGASVRIVRAGRCAPGSGARSGFEAVVEPPVPCLRARRAAREALARAVVAARIAADEAGRTASAAAAAGAAAPAVLARLGARLRAQALPEPLVIRVLDRVASEVRGADLEEIEAVMRAAAVGAVASLLPTSAAHEPFRRGAAGRPWVVALAGPTGVGKTTTLAKVAAGWRMQRGLRVGLIAADAFRVGAFEQLRTYARIIDAPVRAADGRASALSALEALAECDVVLVDTPGRGHRDAARIAEVADLVEAVRADETHLVLPGTAGAQALEEASTAFARVRPTRVVLSKLDESEGLGALVGAVRVGGIPASWFTTGQEVPDDLERADARAFAERLVGGAGA